MYKLNERRAKSVAWCLSEETEVLFWLTFPLLSPYRVYITVAAQAPQLNAWFQIQLPSPVSCMTMGRLLSCPVVSTAYYR